MPGEPRLLHMTLSFEGLVPKGRGVLVTRLAEYLRLKYRRTVMIDSAGTSFLRRYCIPFLLAASAWFALPGMALDSSDLLFRVSFDQGVSADFSRGGSKPAAVPPELNRRLVDGLFGKAYLFNGKGSTLEFETAGTDRASSEMYGPRVNMFPDAGTVSFWIKALKGTNNMAHVFFRCWPLDVMRDEYGCHYFRYTNAGRGIYYYDILTRDQWMHVAVTWRKDQSRGYFNGKLMSTVNDVGVLTGLNKTFTIASEGMTWLDFQTKTFEDETVMDEFQLFRRPLSDEEVRSLFERGRVKTTQYEGNRQVLNANPERIHAPQVISVPAVSQPVKADADLTEWKNIPDHGCFTEIRLGVLDSDPGKIRLASDAGFLYVAFRVPVDDSIQEDPMHVWYPTGQFKAASHDRDGAVLDDDFVQFAVKGKDGSDYRFSVNAMGSLIDTKNGDAAWNGGVQWAGRSDFKDWTVEAAIPLSDLGAAPGDTVEFNVLRSWKLFKSAENTLAVSEQWTPGWAKLILGQKAGAALESLGEPGKGKLAASGIISGPDGDYTVRVHGKGFGQEFTEEKRIAVTGGAAAFLVERQMEKPGDLAVLVSVNDPTGSEILSRTVPLVFTAASTVELQKYPGWGKLDVAVVPASTDLKGVTATVTLARDGKELAGQSIAEFDNPEKTVRFDTAPLSPGRYEVTTKVQRDSELLGEDRQFFDKHPLPEWYKCTTGVIEKPPVPWTDVQVEGGTVNLLMKKISFSGSLFPAELVANGQSLLAGPMRLKVKRGETETVLTAGNVTLRKQSARRAVWTSVAADGDLTATISGWIEFDGFTWLDMTLAGGSVDRLTLEIPLRAEMITLKNLNGPGLMPSEPMKAPWEYGGYWFGNEKAGFVYYWETNRGWVSNNEPVLITPGTTETVIAIPFIQKTADLTNARTITFGWQTTPVKPLRKDQRYIMLHKGVTYTTADYANVTPNYPRPLMKEEDYAPMREQLKKKDAPITCFYAFGNYAWPGSPEYAEWWREWRFIPSEVVKPDPNSIGWAPACYNSSSSDLQVWLLNNYMKNYPQRGIYFDCVPPAFPCSNEAHGCGYVDENGIRRPVSQIINIRRHFERIYNVIKSHDPVYGWVRMHDWCPNVALASFFDDNWFGEGLISPLIASPEKNYCRVVDLPYARVVFGNEKWGHYTSWLTEMACVAGNDPEKRAEWYGKMVEPPKDGKRGKWTLPRWTDYEHVAGLGIIHDMWAVGGNDLQLPWMKLLEMERRMGWDDNVRFVGYWELGDLLQVEGGVKEKIVCSLYYRPAVEEAAGTRSKPWLMLAPMNNTDEDITLTLKPNLEKFGLDELADGQLRDAYRGMDYTFDGEKMQTGWRANAGDPEAPYMEIKGEKVVFPMENGAAQVSVGRRNFRALILEPKD